jgi:hypothetical protein
METELAMQKISFEFVGGPNDGKILSGILGDASEAERYYLFSQQGKLGCKIKVASPYAVDSLANEELTNEQPLPFQQHFYVVTHRYEADDEIAVRVEYE